MNQQFYLSPVVKILLIMNVVIYVITTFIAGDIAPYLYVYYPTSEAFQPFQLLTHMFMHSPRGLTHIVFNMLGLAMFGSFVEMIWGEQRFLFYYLFCGFGAVAVHFLSIYWAVHTGALSPQEAAASSLLGASGCVYGVMAACGILAPEQRMGMMFLPVQIPAKFFVPIMIGIDLLLGVSNQQTGVGHFAHYGGAMAGLLLMGLWTIKRR